MNPLEAPALISLIIPVYNVEKYLPACLDSALAQDYPHLEIILVNDGSTDSSGEICHRYADKDARIRVLTQRNMGLGEARNTGLAHCKGAFVAFADSDDILAPRYISALYELIKDRAGCIAMGEALYFPDGEECVFPQGHREAVSLSPREALLQCLYQSNSLDVSAWGRMYPTSLFSEGNIRYPATYYEDLGTTYRLIGKSCGAVQTNGPLYGYRQRTGSIMASGFNPKKEKDICFITGRLLDDLSHDSPELLRAARCRCFCAISNVYMTTDESRNGDSAKALWKLIKEYRSAALLNFRARRKARLGAAVSYLGPKAMRLCYSMMRKA